MSSEPRRVFRQDEARQATRESPSKFSPWLAIGGLFGVYFAFGLAVGAMAPLVDEISTDLDLSRAAMGSILGAWSLIYVFTAVPAGAVVDRLGLRWALTLGGLAIALSLLLRSLATGGVTLFGAVAIFGIGGPLVSVATPKLVASLFNEDDRKLPTGLAVSAPAVGSALALAITDPLLLPLTDQSWRAVLLILTGVALFATVVWLYASRAVAHISVAAQPRSRETITRLLGLTSMRRILAVSLFGFFIALSLTNWLPEILADSGQSESVAGYLAALSVTASIAGSILIVRVVPAAWRSRFIIAIFVLLAALMLGLSTLPTAPLVLALAVLGFVRAGIGPLLFLEIMDDSEIGLADIGAATGLYFAVGEIGGFLGPYATGFVADRTSGFGAANAMLALACGLGAAASWRLSQIAKT